MIQSANEAKFFKKFNASLEYLSQLYIRIDPNKSKNEKAVAETKFRDFLKTRNLKPDASEVDNDDDEQDLSPMQKFWRQNDKDDKEWMEKQDLERKMIEDPEKKISKLLDSFNNITEETKQLIEVKDIIDELNMILEVQTDQLKVITDFRNSSSMKSNETDFVMYRLTESLEYQRSEVNALLNKADDTMKAVRKVQVDYLKKILTF
jgi:hypothetical protein